MFKEKPEPSAPGVYELRYIKLNLHTDDFNPKGELWLYLGREYDYLIIPGAYCSCRDYIIRTIINKTSRYCKHQVGVYLALKKNKYLTLNTTLEEAYQIIREILERGFSLLVRKKLK